jgi:hypothetical protein
MSLLGVKQTSQIEFVTSAFDPKRTSGATVIARADEVIE